MLVLGNNHNNNLNGNNNLNNNARFLGITLAGLGFLFMKTYRNLWDKLCSEDNLYLAYKKARKHKTQKPYVLEFEKDLQNNLSLLRTELLLHAYQPKPLQTFIVRDPKTRKISKAHFRDRVIHHALCNLIEPIFETSFIYDSYANRKGKGTLKAIKRFESFSRIVSNNHIINTFVLKADIKHYFEEVNHSILIRILEKKIKDKKVMWLIRKILRNHSFDKGMPLGNLTSQFLANVYLNELDQFIKRKLKIRYYLRYVDDFVILDNNKDKLRVYRQEISNFLTINLKLHLHPHKTSIRSIKQGITFLGARIFPFHRLLKKGNVPKLERKIFLLQEEFELNKIYYDQIYAVFEGWLAYAHHYNTYILRQKVIDKYEKTFPHDISTIEINRSLK
ncbi:MAG: reverse transcriptase/maturase family protein [Candidatus Woesearchaeota archaeon]